MPTDHGPELEALRKRLADAKEFLDLAGKERELAGLRGERPRPTCGTTRAGPPGHEPAGRRRGDLQTVARLQRQLEDLEALNQLALEENDDSVAAELTQGLAT